MFLLVYNHLKCYLVSCSCDMYSCVFQVVAYKYLLQLYVYITIDQLNQLVPATVLQSYTPRNVKKNGFMIRNTTSPHLYLYITPIYLHAPTQNDIGN